MVLILPQHADHQDLLIPQQVDHQVLHQHYERPEYQLWNFLFLLIKSSFYDSFLLWWMAVLLFRAKPVSDSTSRKWDRTCLALLTRRYHLASLSPRWDSGQIQSLPLNRAGEMFAETQVSSLDRCAKRNSELSVLDHNASSTKEESVTKPNHFPQH